MPHECRTDGRMGAATQYKLIASVDFWEEIKIMGLRTEGEMSEAGIGEAARRRDRQMTKQGERKREKQVQESWY